MFNRELKPPSKPMPPFCLFPVGSWVAITAVMLMIFCVTCVSVIVIYYLGLNTSHKYFAHVLLAIGAILALILSVLTGLVSRGYVYCNTLLLKFNRLCLVILFSGNVIAIISKDFGVAAIAATGFICGLIVHQIYRSKKYQKWVEHYEVIWAHHRWNNRKVK